MKGGETSTYLMIPIVSTLDRGEFTVKLKAFSSQREDYEEIPISVDVCSNKMVKTVQFKTKQLNSSTTRLSLLIDLAGLSCNNVSTIMSKCDNFCVE